MNRPFQAILQSCTGFRLTSITLLSHSSSYACGMREIRPQLDFDCIHCIHIISMSAIYTLRLYLGHIEQNACMHSVCGIFALIFVNVVCLAFLMRRLHFCFASGMRNSIRNVSCLRLQTGCSKENGCSA